MYYLSKEIDQKRKVGGFGNGVFQSLQNKTKGAMERIELGMNQQKKLDTTLEMTTCVANDERLLQ